MQVSQQPHLERGCRYNCIIILRNTDLDFLVYIRARTNYEGLYSTSQTVKKIRQGASKRRQFEQQPTACLITILKTVM